MSGCCTAFSIQCSERIEALEKKHAKEVKALKDQIAALTGAAPADANVGWQDAKELVLAKYPQAVARSWESGSGFSIYMDEKAFHPFINHTGALAGAWESAAKALDLRPTPTAPEPSAPADKDAERYRKLMREVNNGFWGVCEHIVVDRLGATDPLWMDDKAMADAAIDKLPSDAAIARMRSESGKGGKL